MVTWLLWMLVAACVAAVKAVTGVLQARA